MNLLTIADGFGDSQAIPGNWYPDYVKWPDIIKFMTKGINLCNLSRYGAGNEYIINCLRQTFSKNDTVLIQWAPPDRLDLVLAHDKDETVFWQEKISTDTVYNNNILQLEDNQIWLSSASTLPEVKLYHKRFITGKQHQLRSQMFVDYATLLLADKLHGFLLSYSSHYLENTVSKFDSWIWHQKFQGMNEFRFHSKYSDLDLGMTQPIPLIHFDFITQFIQPRFDLQWRNQREIQGVENMLYRKYKESIEKRPQ